MLVMSSVFLGDNSIRDTLSEEPYYLFNADHVLLKIVEPDFDGTNTIPIDFLESSFYNRLSFNR